MAEGKARGRKKRTVYSKPMDELPIQNAKYIKNCLEMYLAKRNIDKLRGFEVFANLEVVWLNHNNLTSVRGLEENFRLKELYLHNNKLASLKGVRLPCNFLTRLTLFDNQITNLNAVIECISKLHTLEQLDMRNNPCAEEPNYRLRVIQACPSVHVLDRHIVKDDERAQAEALYQKKLKLQKRAKAESIRSSARGSQAGSQHAGTHQGGDAASRAGSRAGSSHTRNTRTKLSLMEEEKDEDDSGLSGTVKILYRELARIEREESAQEEADQKKTYAKAMQALEEQKELSGEKLRQAVLPKAINFKQIEENRDDMELGAWQIYRLRKLFEAHDDDGGGELDLEEVKGVLTEMEDYGWVLSGDSDSSIKLLFEEIDQDSSGKVSIDEFILGMQEIMSEEAGGAVSSSQKDSGDAPSIKWVLLDQETAMARSNKLSRKAGYTQSKALSLPDNDSRKSELMRDAVELSRKSTRLRIIAEKQEQKQAGGGSYGSPAGRLARGLDYDTSQLKNERGDWLKYYHCEFKSSGSKKAKSSRYDDSDSDSDYEDDSDTELDSSQKKRTPAKYRGNAEVLDMNDMGKRKPIDRLDATFLKKERKQRGTLRQRFGLTKRNKDYNKFAEDKISQGGCDLSEHISEI
eukprot:g2799.t1